MNNLQKGKKKHYIDNIKFNVGDGVTTIFLNEKFGDSIFKRISIKKKHGVYFAELTVYNEHKKETYYQYISIKDVISIFIK
jgi:hypothetical protein